MNIDISDIPAKAKQLFEKLNKYMGFLVLVIVLMIYGFIILQIKNFALNNPSETEVANQLNGLNVQKIDDGAIDKIKQLEETNVEVKALFKEARNNPFQE